MADGYEQDGTRFSSNVVDTERPYMGTLKLSGILFGHASFLCFLLEGVLCARTLPRLLVIQIVFLLSIILGMAIWRWIGDPLGGFGSVMAVTLCGLLIAFVLWVLLLGQILLFYPFPSCKQGQCSTIADYKWDARFIYGRVGWNRYVYECRCGDTYFRHGERFLLIVKPDGISDSSRDVPITSGNTRPYKKLIGFRRWGRDDDPSGYKGS